MRTPWGASQTVKPLSNGITWVSTAGHGGVFVPKKLLGRIPAAYQAYAAKWTGSPQWYEEDCAWACVAVSFPEVFSAEDVATAKQTIARWVTPCATCGQTAVSHGGVFGDRQTCPTFTAEAA